MPVKAVLCGLRKPVAKSMISTAPLRTASIVPSLARPLALSNAARKLLLGMTALSLGSSIKATTAAAALGLRRRLVRMALSWLFSWSSVGAGKLATCAMASAWEFVGSLNNASSVGLKAGRFKMGLGLMRIRLLGSTGALFFLVLRSVAVRAISPGALAGGFGWESSERSWMMGVLCAGDSGPKRLVMLVRSAFVKVGRGATEGVKLSPRLF